MGIEAMETDYRQAIVEAIGGLTRSTVYVPFRATCVVDRHRTVPHTVYALKAWVDDSGEHIVLCDRRGMEVESLDEITEESQKLVFCAITAD